MTEQEAIDILGEFQTDKPILEMYYGECHEKALLMAISALKEIQKYWALGTVEQIEERMLLTAADETILREYEELGFVEELREAREKQVPKKPTDICEYELDIYKFGKCPVCGEGCNDGMKYCDQCGTRLDWSDEE